MAGLLCGGTATVRPAARSPCSRRVAVRPSVRSGPSRGGSASMVLRGSARWAGTSGLGDTAASFPAGGGPVREASSAFRTGRVNNG